VRGGLRQRPGGPLPSAAQEQPGEGGGDGDGDGDGNVDQDGFDDDRNEMTKLM
jgi:hypothetical protein